MVQIHIRKQISFSGSGFFGDKKKLRTIKATLNPRQLLEKKLLKNNLLKNLITLHSYI